jgi:hypothetical protein
MKKIINFSNQQIVYIKKICKDKEISFTEMIKRIIDEFIEKNRKSMEPPCPK